MCFWKWANSLKCHVNFCMFIFLGEKICDFPKILQSSRIAAKENNVKTWEGKGRQYVINLSFSIGHVLGMLRFGLNLPMWF